MQPQHPDTPAFADAGTALFDQYGELIFTHIRAHIKIREDAEDLATEVFASALENQQILLVTRSEQLAWLRRVAHNKIIDYYRRQQRRPTVALDDAAYMLPDEQGSPEDLVLRQERHSSLHQHISELPPLQQYILRLRYGHGLRFKEIALMVEKNEATIRQLLSRSIRVLRSKYTAIEEEGA